MSQALLENNPGGSVSASFSFIHSQQGGYLCVSLQWRIQKFREGVSNFLLTGYKVATPTTIINRLAIHILHISSQLSRTMELGVS